MMEWSGQLYLIVCFCQQKVFFARDQKIDKLEEKILGERLTNVLSNCTFLLKKENRLCISGKKIESKYNGTEQTEEEDRRREDRDYEGEDESHERQKVSDDVIHKYEKCIIKAYIRE